jgi:hypothetical protein
MNPYALASLVLALTALSTAQAFADDYGPHRDIRAIRGAIPVLLASRVRAHNLDPSALHVDDVVVNGDEAVARWDVRGHGGLVGLARTYRVWWLTGEINEALTPNETGTGDWISAFPGSLSTCDATAGAGTANIVAALHVLQQTADLAAIHIQVVRDATARQQQGDPSMILFFACSAPKVPERREITLSKAGNYIATLASAQADDIFITRFTGRAPTAAEFPPSPGANAVYFFSFEIGGTASATVHDGSLDVWCPFVLDPSQRYSLTIDYVTPAVGPIYGTLFDNRLHFDLPAFTIQPNASAMGEIDFLPPRRY